VSLVMALAASGGLAGLVGLAARYGADSRTGADPTGRDPAWPGSPSRPHTVRADLERGRGILAGLRRLWDGQVRAHSAHDRALRPWEGPRPGATPEQQPAQVRRATVCHRPLGPSWWTTTSRPARRSRSATRSWESRSFG
jgi:hypothetical protein